MLAWNANNCKPMAHKIVDTNVPLTAAGMNTGASENCEHDCGEVISSIMKGEITVLVDEDDSAISEYRNNMYPDPKGTRAGQFLMYLLVNRRRPDRVRSLKLQIDEYGNFLDYPDCKGTWTSNDPRCKTFDKDDKKWVALAVRFAKDAGEFAPIVNATDRCWLAFESHLESAGVTLEILCRDEREQNRN